MEVFTVFPQNRVQLRFVEQRGGGLRGFYQNRAYQRFVEFSISAPERPCVEVPHCGWVNVMVQTIVEVSVQLLTLMKSWVMTTIPSWS